MVVVAVELGPDLAARTQLAAHVDVGHPCASRSDQLVELARRVPPVTMTTFPSSLPILLDPPIPARALAS